MIQFLLYAVFFLSAILLVAIILLQEGKGGGLSDAFGAGGAETFGPRAGGINRFTFGLFSVWILSALLLHWSAPDPNQGSVMQPVDPPAGTVAPGPDSGAGGAPGGTGGAPGTGGTGGTGG